MKLVTKSVILLLWLLMVSPFYLIGGNPNSPKEQLDRSYKWHREGTKAQRARSYTIAIQKYDSSLLIKNALFKQEFDQLDATQKETLLGGIIRSNFNIGVALTDLGQLQAAEDQMKKCLQLFNDFSSQYGLLMPDRRGRIHYQLGVIYSSTKGIDDALEQFELAKNDYSEQTRLAIRSNLVNALSNLFMIWSEPDSIKKYSLMQFRMFENINPAQVASASINLGVGEGMQGNCDIALAYFDKGLAFYRSDSLTYKIKIASIYHDKALVLSDKGDWRAAIEAINVANKIYKSSKLENDDYLRGCMVKNYNARAFIFFKAQAFDKALKDYRTSINYNLQATASPNQEASLEEILMEDIQGKVLNKLSLLHSLGYKGKIQFALHHYEAAAASFTFAINYLNKIRREYNDTESKLKLTEIAKVIFEGAIALHLDPEVYQPEKAFTYAEQSRAFTLLEGVKHSKAMRIAKVPQDLLDQEYQLRGKIAKLERNYQGAKTPEKKAELLQIMQSEKEQLTALLNKLQRNKVYRKLMSFEAPKVKRIQRKALGKGQTLVEYFAGEEKTYVFVLPRQGKIKVLQLDIRREELNQKIDTFWSSIYHYGCDTLELRREAPHLAGMKETVRKAWLKKKYLELGQELYAELFQPIINLALGDRFVIVPDEGLSYLPFDALLQGPPEIDRFSFYPYLGHNYTLSYAYSGNLLLEMRSIRRSRDNGILALAPSFDSRNLALNKSTLSRLTNNQTEVRSICELFPNRCLQKLDTNATREVFLELVKEHAFSIIHLSTHGKADDKNPNQSWISFTQRNRHLDESQLLYASDLYALPIQADLVVLSACETNKGRLRRGEGIMSFARGLSAAGVKSVLSTFWVIGESPSLLIMKDFYQQLNAGAAKDVALQRARKNLMVHGDFSHPYYWSAFVPIGQMSEVSAGMSWWWVLLGIGILLGLFAFRKLTKLRAED